MNNNYMSLPRKRHFDNLEETDNLDSKLSNLYVISNKKGKFDLFNSSTNSSTNSEKTILYKYKNNNDLNNTNNDLNIINNDLNIKSDDFDSKLDNLESKLQLLTNIITNINNKIDDTYNTLNTLNDNLEIINTNIIQNNYKDTSYQELNNNMEACNYLI